jgi:hypothetical protein
MIQTIKTISDKPRMLREDHICIGIVKDSNEYYAVIYNFTNKKLYIEILDWGIGHDLDNAKLVYIDDSEQYAYIHEQIENYTKIITQDYIKQIDAFFQLYTMSSTYIDETLPKLNDLEHYIEDRTELDVESNFKIGFYYPPQKELKEVIDFVNEKTKLLANKEDYTKHYISSYIHKYIEVYNRILMKDIDAKIDALLV